MNNLSKYLKQAGEEGLNLASSRKLSLLTASFIFFAYTSLLNKFFGYSYQSIGVYGLKKQSNYLMNEERIGRVVGKVIKKIDLRQSIRDLVTILNKHKVAISKLDGESDPFVVLKTLSEIYPKVLMQIGFYNSIMRHISNNKKIAASFGASVKLIGENKDITADFTYNKIEPLLDRTVKKIGRKNGFNGDILKFLTLAELNKYIKQKRLSRKQIDDLVARRKGYFYISLGNKDTIFVGKNIVDRVDAQFSAKDIRKGNVISGISAYPGLVKGRVYKTFHGLKLSKPGYVLVTNITKPSDAPYLKKFSAIVTDEGGILSHVAVISRELKIPCIMSTKIATKVLKNNTLVEVNANKGIVRILK